MALLQLGLLSLEGQFSENTTIQNTPCLLDFLQCGSYEVEWLAHCSRVAFEWNRARSSHLHKHTRVRVEQTKRCICEIGPSSLQECYRGRDEGITLGVYEQGSWGALCNVYGYVLLETLSSFTPRSSAPHVKWLKRWTGLFKTRILSGLDRKWGLCSASGH